MNSKIARRSVIAAVVCTTAAVAATPLLSRAANITVMVNGQQMNFDQPPIERAGRVFVPLRGIFERLGASVVYQGGVINATGNGRNISLRIGSTQATVNGQTQYLDVAPFVVGSRTLVPLRFVAQALGAAVDWNQASQSVAITGAGGQPPSNATPAPNLSFSLNSQRPTGTVSTTTPAIHATFSEPVRRDTMKVAVDGRDVTNDVYANPNGFDVTPSFPLSAGTHRVTVSGVTQAGNSFSRSWTFVTSGSASSGNFIQGLSPSPGTRVSSSFTLSGRTAPNSHVHVIASGEAAAFGGILQIGTGTFQVDAQADANGVFTANVALNAVSGGQVRVVIQSTAPGGSSIERSITYQT
jgi:hypothetical protein